MRCTWTPPPATELRLPAFFQGAYVIATWTKDAIRYELAILVHRIRCAEHREVR